MRWVNPTRSIKPPGNGFSTRPNRTKFRTSKVLRFTSATWSLYSVKPRYSRAFSSKTENPLYQLNLCQRAGKQSFSTSGWWDLLWRSHVAGVPYSLPGCWITHCFTRHVFISTTPSTLSQCLPETQCNLHQSPQKLLLPKIPQEMYLRLWGLERTYRDWSTPWPANKGVEILSRNHICQCMEIK